MKEGNFLMRRSGILLAALTLSLFSPMLAYSDNDSTTTYVESEKTLEQAEKEGLQSVSTTGTQTGSTPSGGPSNSEIIAAMGYTLAGSSRTITTNTESIGLSNGATITMLKGTERGQQLCILVNDGQGNTVVFDGGQKTNAPYLGRYIQAHGGKVDAWFLTHPHTDHVGALAVILERKQSSMAPDFEDFTIGDIYYSFAPMEFYQQEEESYRLPIIEEIYEDLNAFDASKLHYNSPAGTIVTVGGIQVEIMNQAYQFSEDSGNNTSIVYKVTVGGKTLLITGDLPHEAAEQLLKDRGAQALKSDIVQMAHHGQHGGSLAFYQAVSPSYALWPSHQTLWDQVNDSYDENQESYTMALTKHWMDSLSVTKNFVMADGDWVLN